MAICSKEQPTGAHPVRREHTQETGSFKGAASGITHMLQYKKQNGLMMKHKLDLIFRDKNMQSLKLTTNSSPNVSKVLRMMINIL